MLKWRTLEKGDYVKIISVPEGCSEALKDAMNNKRKCIVNYINPYSAPRSVEKRDVAVMVEEGPYKGKNIGLYRHRFRRLDV